MKTPSTDNDRLDNALEAADTAYWDTIAARYPEATSRANGH